MSGVPIELSQQECLERLRAGTIGRVALTAPQGPRIVPVNYAMDGDLVILRTSPYSELAAYGPGRALAMEIDRLDPEEKLGWSVVVHGRGRRVIDPNEVRRIRLGWDPQPWAEGVRNLYLYIDWSELTGRRLGGNRPLTAMIDAAHRLA